MPDQLNPAIGDATRTEQIGSKLAASELFGAALGAAQGNTAHSAPSQPEGAAQTVEQPQGGQVTEADAGAAEAAQRHVVAGVGNHPNVRPPQANPYSQLGELIRANR